MATHQLSFHISEDAPLWIERILDQFQTAVCPAHIGTTLSDEGRCDMCDLEERLMAKNTDIYNIPFHGGNFARAAEENEEEDYASADWSDPR